MENTTKKILIIDDEVDLTQILAFQFRAQGFEVQMAYDGVAGLEAAGKFHPDLIILDINMPRMGGIEFYSKICGPNGRPLYPVLVLTARANIQGLFADLQIDGFMIKPFEIDELVHEADLIIKKRIQQAPTAKSGYQDRPKKVCIVDNDGAHLSQLAEMFLQADYTVMPAQTGAIAVEKMMKEVPDAAVVYLGLLDVPGDLVIHKLYQMAKTKEIKFILYTPKTVKHDPQVMERIGQKTGIFTFVEYDKVEELLDAVGQAVAR